MPVNLEFGSSRPRVKSARVKSARVSSAGCVCSRYVIYMGLCLLMGILIQKDCSDVENINFVSFRISPFTFSLSFRVASTFILILMQLIALYLSQPRKNKTIMTIISLIAVLFT